MIATIGRRMKANLHFMSGIDTSTSVERERKQATMQNKVFPLEWEKRLKIRS